ncbi:hypothetical protein [Anaerocolumna sp.]|uniref:hypothetical protein n=1 Tax=Anaerocolumna sp. TaxID=2041569 RepID=UPI0028AF3475|nr:hypothetical protein [Anaerocolumna sp.]
MQSNIRFSVYEHILVIKDNQLISRKFVVIKDTDKHIVAWTDFHKYIRSGKKIYAKKITDDGNKRFYYVVKLLNYAFYDKYQIKKLTNITIDIVKEFLNDYGMGTLPDDELTRSESTVNVCIRTIVDFLELLYENNRSKCKFKLSDLYKTVEVRNKHGKMMNKKIPVFDVLFIDNNNEIFRDMPESVFSIFLNVIMKRHKDILILVALSAFAGLRPSESCNVRRHDSKLGAGIRFVITDGEVEDIIIDLKKELNLRSDLKKVGTIKKERTQHVYPAFLNAFYECYQIYMDYIEGKKYEADYGALTVNKQGKSITYHSYYGKFKEVIADAISELLNSNDPEAINYAYLLQENNLGPHIFRHWFSVKLTLFGEDVSGLMHWRGDKNPQSALVYLQNKGDLIKQYSKVNNEIFDYNIWRSKKLFGDK